MYLIYCILVCVFGQLGMNSLSVYYVFHGYKSHNNVINMKWTFVPMFNGWFNGYLRFLRVNKGPHFTESLQADYLNCIEHLLPNHKH